MNIRVDYNYPIKDGTEIVFRSPVDCSQVTGLIVYYPGDGGNTTSKEFAFADAHGNNVGDIDHLFAENVVVKVILDVTTGMAFVQNADTNAYLEGRFAQLEKAIGSGGGGGTGGGATVDEVIEELTSKDLDMQGNELKNVGGLTLQAPGTDGVHIVPAGYEENPASANSVPVIEFWGERGDEPAILRCIAPGTGKGDAVNKGQLDDAVGDIESALDHIIEIQNSLIGGEA